MQVITDAKIPGFDETSCVQEFPEKSIYLGFRGKQHLQLLLLQFLESILQQNTQQRWSCQGQCLLCTRSREKYKLIFVFSNPQLTIPSSPIVTVTHRSLYTNKTSSLLRVLLGISISLTTLITTHRLGSTLIRTLGLTQHNPV